ncbi:hypothetical protein ACL7TT_06490 [Microbulbifer sp. 2304DJ12-6]|uniref:Uncharacterized protein n=1 Tax=Microbulbifer spongiae TaxID=2944933 RepID=A0ABY9EGD1_9GAMM|nr:hypothetical protein [Microbulbifer sp. MI-G]WKD49851.1 hypothetical protein M8T91_00025 [Microbulbifer sp. MI-G]
MAKTPSKKDEFKLRDFSEVSTAEIADIARKAGQEARQESLDAGCEVVSEDEQGRTVITKKLPDGTEERIVQGETKDGGE